jgi:hypothetical protein
MHRVVWGQLFAINFECMDVMVVITILNTLSTHLIDGNWIGYRMLHYVDQIIEHHTLL